MIEKPEESIAAYLDSGADWVSVHVEATHHLQRCLEAVRRGGARAGAAVNPGTPVSALEAVWNDLDFAVVMSVNPGWGGQPFLRSSIGKVRQARAEALGTGGRAVIEVDGGVDPGNAAELVEAGAEVLVAGTSIYGQKDVKGAIATLRAAARGGVRV
jgi:ribulose-phosphate 3-epimerase